MTLRPMARRPAALLQGAVLLVLRRDDAGRAGALRRALAGRLRRGHFVIVLLQSSLYGESL